MSFLVRDIIESNLLTGARLLAGERGADSAMRWVNIMEILDMPDSVQPHELLVTTGYQMDDAVRHKNLIASLKARGACGIAIQPGIYIPRIPQYILDDAQRHDFPVIELPKELTFSHITHVLLESIRQKEGQRPAPDAKALMQRLTQWEKSGAAADRARMNETGRCLLWLVPSGQSQNTPEDALHEAIEKVKQSVKQRSARVFLHLEDRAALLYAQGVEGTAYEKIVQDLGGMLHLMGRAGGVNFLAGASALPPGEDLSTGLQEAIAAQKTLERIGAQRGICPYLSMGLFEMLEPLRRSHPVKAQGPLEKLLDYDREHGSAYVQTLRIYIAASGSLADTADRLYIHRHTLQNRLAKITKLCGVGLNDPYARLHLSMELLLHDLFAP
jgi:DNA-binding PucR family transcriptional regulator